MGLLKCFFAILFLLFTIMGYSQGSYLNKTRSQIKSEFSKKNTIKLAPQKNGDDTDFDRYVIDDQHAIMFGYDLDLICTVVTETYQNTTELNHVINDFNNKFEPVDDGHWVTKDKKIDIILVKREGWFGISYHDVDEFL